MQLTLSADLETIINKRLSTGAYADPEDVLRCALEAQEVEEDTWSVEQLSELRAHIEEGWQQAERGELIEPEAARTSIEALKREWRSSRQ